jgi:peptidoglycan hydrolase-like protein with peptidoglycan-binding domain
MRVQSLARVRAAALAALVAALLAAPPASAQSGGVSPGPEPGEQTGQAADGTWYPYAFGARDLSLGMAGADVKTLNWLLRGLALGAPLHGSFEPETDRAVRSFQAAAGLASDGVVRRETRKQLASRMRGGNASWYGPGFYGNTTACGQTLRKGTVGVAHKRLPCGTRVVLAHRGNWARAKVIDRGPYVRGRKWDLTKPLAEALGTIPAGTAPVKAAVVP